MITVITPIPFVLPFLEASSKNIYRPVIRRFLGNMDFRIIPIENWKQYIYWYCIIAQKVPLIFFAAPECLKL